MFCGGIFILVDIETGDFGPHEQRVAVGEKLEISQAGTRPSTWPRVYVLFLASRIALRVTACVNLLSSV